MEFEQLTRLADRFVAENEGNTIGGDIALTKALVGVRMFEKPLICVAEAGDAMFEGLRAEAAIGPHFLTPREWLSNARSVVSLFLPFSETVRVSNREAGYPSPAWLHARIEGQAFIALLCAYLRDEILHAGGACVVPLLDERFWAKMDSDANVYTSNWSERHVAYVCGLGTFGLSKGLISKRGVAGRYASLITDFEWPVTPREYSGLYDYCAMCGECARRCPAGAISLEHGKDHQICAAYVSQMSKRFAPRYGCGKCQVGVPCECAPAHLVTMEGK